MRVTVSHSRPVEEVKTAVDRSFDDFWRAGSTLPLQIVNEKKAWNGSTLTFSFDAKAGFLSAPIKGTVEVTERELIIDADLGLLEKLFPVNRARGAIEGRIRGLLQ